MKTKFFALFLALTISAWAQTATSTQPPATEKNAPVADSKCSCCEKMASHAKADSSEHAQHCMHAATTKEGKDAASCCSSKDASSCCAGKDGKACAKNESASAACCGEKSKAGHEMSCCSEKDGKKTAHNCCGSGQCAHEHHVQPTAGN